MFGSIKACREAHTLCFHAAGLAVAASALAHHSCSISWPMHVLVCNPLSALQTEVFQAGGSAKGAEPLVVHHCSFVDKYAAAV